MKRTRLFMVCGSLCLALSAGLFGQEQASREERGAPNIAVSHTGNIWVIAGQTNRATLNQSDFAITVQAGPATWKLAPSAKDDMLVKSKGEEFYVRLADAGSIEIEPYDTGYKTGVKITLGEFRHSGQMKGGAPLDLRLYLTVCLDGPDEELAFDVSAAEQEAVVRQLDWPQQLDAKEAFDYSVLSNRWGMLLPRNWPKEYHPIHYSAKEVKDFTREEVDHADESPIEGNQILSWSMSWWGFQKGESAMMVLVETPDDATYKFNHPAGGPTVMGPRWRSQLGKFGYPRALRMCFFAKGNYVTMAKRYRRHVMDSGHFVSLKEKIAREPRVQELIGTAHTRLMLLTNYKEDSRWYNKRQPNYNLITFDQRTEMLRKLKARGLDRLYVCIAGWQNRGYDRYHPDAMPPSSDVGGWGGMKRFADAMHELNYLFTFHEQYRNYLMESPSYQDQFALHEEQMGGNGLVYPAARWGGYKVGYVPMMIHAEGGPEGWLNPRFMLGHLMKNNRLMFDHGIRPSGTYIDVFGFVPPDQDFNSEHPTTRTDTMRARAACLRWVRNNVGIAGVEGAADWVVPYVDFGSANPGLGLPNLGLAIPVPLYQLVYHDAIVVPVYVAGRSPLALLYGGVPQVATSAEMSDADITFARRVANLHARIGLLEMTNHEFLDKSYRKERTTFADGTTVTVDSDAGTVVVNPEVK
jgi:hypothetical protein